jgi:Glycosyltransferase family 10 (fucosyltransferase) C-term
MVDPPPPRWRRQLPDAAPVLGECEFIFDPHCREYDWLVVYDSFPSVGDERFSLWCEELACPAENTVFITVEPSAIKSYQPAFLRQFGHVLTGHETWSIDQPGVIRSQPGLRWFYGDGGAVVKTLDEMMAEAPPIKNLDLSTVCSSKKQTHTLHRKRYDFTQRLKAELPELDIFGHGVRPMQDKAVALDPYRYHIAIENHRCDHHWTEKIADAFLGWTLPFYYGCTNLEDYFPKGSFIEIDINNFDMTLATIKETIAANTYEKRIELITEARRLVLERYNFFATIARIVNGDDYPEPNKSNSTIIQSRHAMRRSNLMYAVSFGLQSLKRKWCFRKNLY